MINFNLNFLFRQFVNHNFNLFQKMTEGNYKGIANIGATCYINSFLQTLFMTPEFRDGIYRWTYNQKVHPKREDSILFQLQKLFAKLQLNSSDISTRSLVKSFQWQDSQVFDQQDIQEFNKVLFEALQKSFINDKKLSQPEMIKELYEGQLAHFTKCLECHNESSREQLFQDIILIVKNIYEKIYNSSIELSLQRYIKPEVLDQNNLYECSYCNKKCRAQRGVKFIKLPKLLNVVLQRFHFDFMTGTRNKLNDKCTFPHVLNFNHYFNGYQQIPNKLNQDSSEYFLKQDGPPPPKKVVRKPVTTTKKVVSKAGKTATQPAVVGKVNTKASSDIKSFMQKMRKQKFKQDPVENQDLIYVNGTAPPPPPTTEKSSQQSEKKIEENVNGVKKQNTEEKTQEKEKKQEKVEEEVKPARIIQKPNLNVLPPPPPPLTLETPTLPDPFQGNSIPVGDSKGKVPTLPEQIQKAAIQKQNLIAEREKNLGELQSKNKQAIQLALKDGPLVYELYSILVHSGTSNAGHYFSYIKSFENGKWYVFNDERVHQINVVEMQKTFGGVGFANAYVLYYRLVDENQYKMEYKIPEYMTKIIKEQEESYKMRQISKQIDLQNTLILKIYFQLGVKSIQIMKNSSLNLLFEKCKQTFNIKTFTEMIEQPKITDKCTYVREDNIRIRLFNPVNDTKLDTYRGKQQQSLIDLGIRSYQNFILEVKADSQEFDDYVMGFMSIRIALWKQNQKLESLDQKNITLHKISISRLSNMQQLEQIVKKKRSAYLSEDKEKDCPICIVKRHQNDEYLYHQIINLPDYYTKTLDDVGIFEHQILFIEPDSQNLNWPRQFENEINRISVKFNGINSSQQHSITTDSRITLDQLKQRVCEIINHPVEDTIVRRGNRSGLELKNGNSSLKENHFINGTTLYLEKGLPAKKGQIRIQLFLAEDASPSQFNRLHQFQFIADVPIDTNHKASEVKAVFKNLIKKMRNIDLDCEKIRIREKVNDKMGKIYRERPMRQQQMIEKRQIAIEMKEDRIQMKEYSIYVRTWDQENWTLSPKYEFLVNKNTTMKSLSQQIHNFLVEQTSSNIILPEEMDICRILSIHTFNIIDLVDMEYFGMISDISVFGEPMFVNSDGLLYIIKQTGIEPRELTKDEEIIFGGKIKAYVRPTRGRAPVTSQPQKKEKSLKITVVEKKEQKQEKQEETKGDDKVEIQEQVKGQIKEDK